MLYLKIAPGEEPVRIRSREGVPEQTHVFDDTSVQAVNAALAARRPLLVRGEPGSGKTQLARAVAVKLGRVFVSQVVDSQTEPRDLLWTFDAVARLAEAQVQGALRAGAAPRDSEDLRRRLDVLNYVVPGALWWAFDWRDAEAQARRASAAPRVPSAGASPEEGSVVLIDEIDKAESDVPNGLLEALGEGEFTPQGRTEPVKALGFPPLVVITTNEERALPDPFVRRCLVLQLALPSGDELLAFLAARGRAHFEDADSEVLETAAGMLVEDRERAQKQDMPLPGQAEYIDLVRAVRNLAPGSVAEQRSVLEQIRTFALRKHPEPPTR